MDKASRLQHNNDKMSKFGKRAFGLQASWSPHSEQLAEDQTQVSRDGLQQVSLGDFGQAGQPTAPRPAGLAHMCKAPLDPFAAKPLQSLAALAFDTATIGIHRVAMLARLVGPPRAMFALRLGDVGAEVQVVAQLDRGGAMITLICNRLVDLQFTASLFDIHLGFDQAIEVASNCRTLQVLSLAAKLSGQGVCHEQGSYS